MEGLKYLQLRRIAHRDIKPDNILLGENNTIKISDFSLSVLVKEQNIDEDLEDILNSKCMVGRKEFIFPEKVKQANINEGLENILNSKCMVGRAEFIFPEIVKGADFAFKADIYTTGLTILYLISEKNPFEIIKDKNNKDIRKIHEEYIFKTYNKYLIKLIKKMMKADNNLRPNSSQCLEELENIEKIIDNPNDELAKKYLENK